MYVFSKIEINVFPDVLHSSCNITFVFPQKKPSVGFNFRFDIPDKSALHQRGGDRLKKNQSIL